jgi:hypothetical membrane protein
MDELKSNTRTDSVVNTFLTPKFAGYIALVSIFQFIICVSIGAIADPEWELFENTLCHLGVSDIGFIKVLYPITCTILGIGAMFFGCIVAMYSTHKLQIIGYNICILFGISLIGIGVISIDIDYTLHMIFVYIMGTSAGFVIGLTSIDDFRNGNRYSLPYFIFVMLFFLYFTFFDMRYQQPFVYVAMCIWLFVKCHHLITTDTAY